jgi:hypothetical protein
MNAEFTAIIQTLITEQGKDALVDPVKCKAFLPDYTKNEYVKERRLLQQAVEAGVAKEIDAAARPNICKKQQVRHLKEELFMAEDMAADVVDLLAFVLRGDTGRTEPEFPQSAPDVEAKPCETKDVPSKYKYSLRVRIFATVFFVFIIGACLLVIVTSIYGGLLAFPFILLSTIFFSRAWAWVKNKKTG